MSKRKNKEQKPKPKYYRLDELVVGLTISLGVGMDKQGRGVRQTFRELHCGKARCELYANSCTACLRAIVNDPALKAEHKRAMKEYSAKKSGLVLPGSAKKKVVTP
jgi:hypothetical protein